MHRWYSTWSMKANPAFWRLYVSWPSLYAKPSNFWSWPVPQQRRRWVCLHPDEEIDLAKPPVHLLSPLLFRGQVRYSDLDIMQACAVIPPLQKMLFISRDMTDVVCYTDAVNVLQELKIDSTIPKYHIMTVKLKMNKAIQDKHDWLYTCLIKQMKPKENNFNQTALKLSDSLADTAQDEEFMDFWISWHLSMLSSSNQLEMVMKLTGNKNLADNIQHWSSYDNYEVSFFIYSLARILSCWHHKTWWAWSIISFLTVRKL